IIPKMNPHHLIKGFKKIIKELYNPKSFYQRISLFLDLFKLQNSFNPDFQYFKVNKAYLLGVPRILFKFGFFEKERLMFWKLFLKTLLHKPKALTTVLAQIVSGYHIRKIYEGNK
ncbi:MAG: DUF4070 domain-containing protein, partial [Caldimicrobium sp.]